MKANATAAACGGSSHPLSQPRKTLGGSASGGAARRLDSGIKPQYRIRLVVAGRLDRTLDCRNGRENHAQHAIVTSARAIAGGVHARAARAGGIDPLRPARAIQAGGPLRGLSACAGVWRVGAEARWTSAV